MGESERRLAQSAEIQRGFPLLIGGQEFLPGEFSPFIGRLPSENGGQAALDTLLKLVVIIPTADALDESLHLRRGRPPQRLHFRLAPRSTLRLGLPGILSLDSQPAEVESFREALGAKKRSQTSPQTGMNWVDMKPA